MPLNTAANRSGAQRLVVTVPVAHVRPPEVGLARGPGCLGQALGLSREHDGADLGGGGPLALTPGEPMLGDRVRSGPRVGVRLAHDVPWRFWVADDPTVSRYQRNPRAV